ncbi:hypothetical protein AB0G81_00655 [Streptomyces asoensis]
MHQARIIRLDRDVNGPLPRRLRRLTPDEQQRNVRRMLAGLQARKAG